MNSHAKGITFIELLIIIIIVVLLAVIVVPELAPASLDVRDRTLQSQLDMMRARIASYRCQHDGKCPDAENFISQLTMPTNTAGRVMPLGGNPKDYPFGPYLRNLPSNPYVNRRISDHVQIDSRPPGGGDAGWHYNPKTGVFSTDHNQSTNS